MAAELRVHDTVSRRGENSPVAGELIYPQCTFTMEEMVLQNPGAAVAQRQLWPEGSCYVWFQADLEGRLFWMGCHK
ncbi:hypothetical protein DV515_00009990 [Chloebia gouldiae]|uniref:Uncharacterized protein n=1 Tax=Chloebia gouldiae TaxID=44316 RepID=A0A3L8SAJ0_CHLGU|nr:hypothetical protein DV515_00009990 [Chloebia gouldiae]